MCCSWLGKGQSSHHDFVVQLIDRSLHRDGNIRYYEYEADDLFHLSVLSLALRSPLQILTERYMTVRNTPRRLLNVEWRSCLLVR